MLAPTVTPPRTFWSVSRQDFIPASELYLGEQVVALDGQVFRLTSIVPRAGPQTVYNLEVAIDHVYYAGDDGLLVQNTYKSAGQAVRNSAEQTARSQTATKKSYFGPEEP